MPRDVLYTALGMPIYIFVNTKFKGDWTVFTNIIFINNLLFRTFLYYVGPNYSIILYMQCATT